MAPRGIFGRCRGGNRAPLLPSISVSIGGPPPSVLQSGKAVPNDDLPACHIHWVDVANIHERMRIMQPWQRINHFPGMTNIARKARLSQNLEKMRKAFPKVRGVAQRMSFGPSHTRLGRNTRSIPGHGCCRWSSRTSGPCSTQAENRTKSLLSRWVRELAAAAH